MTLERYLALEREAETRSEYADGQIFAMAGASRRHNKITANILASLHGQLRGRGCDVYANDMRTRAPDNRYVYPDVVVICGKPEFEDAELDTLLNPTLIVEVASQSTALYDKTVKFDRYRLTPSLLCYVVVEQARPRVERYERVANADVPPENATWTYCAATSLWETLELPAIGCALALSDVYEGAEFDEKKE